MTLKAYRRAEHLAMLSRQEERKQNHSGWQATYRHWEDNFLVSDKISNVAVEGHTLGSGSSLGGGHGNTQKCVGAQA
jgi:hypothetical protein